MQLSFLKTRIGASILVALLLIALGAGTKIYSNHVSAKSEVAQKVGLIADSSVQQGLKNGTINWEDSLKLLKNSDATTTPNATSLGTASSTMEVTATDKFARELFTLYTQAKQSGKAIDEATANQIAESALSNDYSGQMPLATADDIKITTDTSRARAKSYGNAVGVALSAKRPNADQDLFILERLINGTGTEKDKSDIGLIFNYYKSISAALRTVTVPQDATASHLDLINGINYLSRAMEGMLTLETDPISSLTKIKGYQDGLDTLAAGDLGLKNYFASKGVTFSSDEAGYKFGR